MGDFVVRRDKFSHYNQYSGASGHVRHALLEYTNALWLGWVPNGAGIMATIAYKEKADALSGVSITPYPNLRSIAADFVKLPIAEKFGITIRDAYHLPLPEWEVIRSTMANSKPE